MYYQNPNYLTGNEAAALAGVSRRTIYKWIEQGRISSPITKSEILKQEKRKRGPKRSPYSRRYVYGRHRFEKASG